MDNEEYNYDSYYQNNDDNNDVEEKKGGKKVFLIIMIILLIIGLLAGGYFLLKKYVFDKEKEEPPVIERTLTINNQELTLEVGNTYQLEVTSNYELNGNYEWVSSDPSVINVSKDGFVTAFAVGSSTVTYQFIDSDNIAYSVSCLINVTKKGTDVPPKDPVNDTEKPTLRYSITSGRENAWVNKDVTIKVTASDNVSSELKVKYTVNCSSNCKYTDITSKKSITISSNGTSNVKIVAEDSSGNTTTKTVKVMIDKEKPTLTLDNNSKTITGTGTVKVCATCTDKDSGCKQEKICREFTKSASNQTISVTDKAGNATLSSAFNVTVK